MRLNQKSRLYMLGDSENFDNIYYVEDGIVKKQPFGAFNNTKNSPFLPRNPVGWKDEEISLATSEKYKSLIRSFNLAIGFVYEGAEIARYRQYAGRGFEEIMYLAILKWDMATGIFYLEYKGKLDLSTTEDDIKLKSVKVNSIEGGALSYLNANDAIDYGINCDESNPDIQQLYLDGMDLKETLNYSFLNVDTDGNESVVPLVFLNNEGDHEGVLFGSPIFETVGDPADYFPPSENYLIQNIGSNDITFHFEGDLSLRGIDSDDQPGIYKLFYQIADGTDIVIPTTLILQTAFPTGAKTMHFSFDVTLAQGQKLFFYHFNFFTAPDVTGGNIMYDESAFKISFISRKEPTYSFCLSLYNYMKQLWAKVCEGKYPFESEYLKARTDLVITCGDALRNSDRAIIPNYTIVSSWQDAFQSIPPDANIGSGIGLQVKNSTLYLELLSDLYSDSVTIFDLGQVSNFKIKVATDVIHNSIAAGYPDQQYESNSGKYEFNSEQNWKLTILSVKRELNLRSVWRADSRGIELIRAKFTHLDSTDNSGDQEPFLIQVSSQTLSEAYTAQTSAPADYTGGNNITFDGAISGNYMTTDDRILFSFNGNYQRANVDVYLYVNNTGHTIQAILYKNGKSIAIYTGNNTNGDSVIHLSLPADNMKLGDTYEVLINPFEDDFQDFTVVAATLHFEFLNKPLLLLRDFDTVTGVTDNSIFNTGLRPKNQILGHGNEIHGICAQLNDAQIELTSYAKNVELVTVKDGISLSEKSPIDIANLARPLWLPYDFEITTQTPYYFTELLAMSTVGYFSFIYNGIQFYALPIGDMKSTPATNGAQQWTLRAAARNLFLDFYKVGNDISTNFNFDTNMVASSIYCPLHLVKYGFTPQAKYHNIELNEDWSYHRYNDWFVSGKNAFYTQKWQTSDTIKVPLITAGLGQLEMFIYDEFGNLYDSGLFNVLPAPSVRPPLTLQEFDITIADEGLFLFVVKAGTTNVFVSEWCEVKEDWPDTFLNNYSNSFNEQNIPWLAFNGYLQFRCEALFEQWEPLIEAVDYEDDNGDFTILNGTPLKKRNLVIGTTRKVPEWVGLKMNAILLKDKVYIEGEQTEPPKRYTRREAVQMEMTKYPGMPYLSYVIEVIPAENSTFTQIENVPIDDVYGWHATITTQVFGLDTGSTEITILNE